MGKPVTGYGSRGKVCNARSPTAECAVSPSSGGGVSVQGLAEPGATHDVAAVWGSSLTFAEASWCRTVGGANVGCGEPEPDVAAQAVVTGGPVADVRLRCGAEALCEDEPLVLLRHQYTSTF